jgi:hypothetical protein
MTVEEIAALPVGSIAHDDCVLWLWTTNAHLLSGDALAVCKAWGFEPKTILTWAKDKMGFGVWLRGQTEHCIWQHAASLLFISRTSPRYYTPQEVSIPRSPRHSMISWKASAQHRDTPVYSIAGRVARIGTGMETKQSDRYPRPHDLAGAMLVAYRIQRSWRIWSFYSGVPVRRGSVGLVAEPEPGELPIAVFCACLTEDLAQGDRA